MYFDGRAINDTSSQGSRPRIKYPRYGVNCLALVAIGAGVVAGAEEARNGHYAAAAIDLGGATLGGAGLLAKLRAVYMAARAGQITADSFMSAADQAELVRLIRLRRSYLIGSETLFGAERAFNLNAEIFALLNKGFYVVHGCR